MLCVLCDFRDALMPLPSVFQIEKLAEDFLSGSVWHQTAQRGEITQPHPSMHSVPIPPPCSRDLAGLGRARDAGANPLPCLPEAPGLSRGSPCWGHCGQGCGWEWREVGGVCRGCQGPEGRSGGVVGVSPCHPSETDADLTKWGPVRGASREGLGL